MSLTVRILGCGSSGGVPRIGNNWGNCDPANPKNRRTRASIMIRREGGDGFTNVLIDTAPDLREQLLAAETCQIDSVLYTHEHADQTHGIDDLRALALISRARVPIFADDATGAMLRTRFGYCFKTPPGSQYPPILDMHNITAKQAINVAGPGGIVTAMPFPVEHGEIKALGFRVGGLAYTPDISGVLDENLHFVEGLDCWIIDSLRHAPHPSHFSLDDALAWIEKARPKRAVLTNMHVDLDYGTLCASVPDNVTPAYDGMTIGIAGGTAARATPELQNPAQPVCVHYSGEDVAAGDGVADAMEFVGGMRIGGIGLGIAREEGADVRGAVVL